MANKVFLIGNLGDEVKLHFFENGNCLGRVSMATSERYKKKDSDEWVENVEWHNLVFRNKAAEMVEKLTYKGFKMMVYGRIKYRTWQDKDGVDKYTTEIAVQDFEFLSKIEKKEDNHKKVESAPPVQPMDNLDEDDDLPF